MNIRNNRKIAYIVALSFFAFVSSLRFFDRDIIQHEVLFPILNDYVFAIVMTAIYIVVFVILSGISVYKADDSKLSHVFYLYATMVVLVSSMYWNQYYLGASDIYSYICMFISLILIINNKLLYLIPLLSVIGCVFSPISIFSSQIAVLMIILLLSIERKDTTLKKVFILDLIAVSIAVVVRSIFFGFDVDTGETIDFVYVIIMLILFVPFYVILVAYAVKVRRSKVYVLAMILGLTGSIGEGIFSDGARAVFFGFTYYLFLITTLYICGHTLTERATEDTGKLIRKYVPWPGILPAYLVVIVAFLISGQIELFEEIIISK